MDSLWTAFELLEIMKAVEAARKELERREREAALEKERALKAVGFVDSPDLI